MSKRRAKPRLKRYWPRLLFLIPFFAMLWVPSYNRIAPELAGIPFFYWYQLAWVLIGAAIALTAYAIETRVTHTSEPVESESDSSGTPGDIL
jgi:Protein of unknown function (DUF3311)